MKKIVNIGLLTIVASFFGCGDNFVLEELKTNYDAANNNDANAEDVNSETGYDATDSAQNEEKDGGNDAENDVKNDAVIDSITIEANDSEIDSETNDSGFDSSDSEVDANCGNTLTDPLNCGYCNHSCEGGNCTNGKCGPVVIATDQLAQNPGDIVTDSEFVYWIHSYGVTKQSKHGGPSQTICFLSGDQGSLVIVGNYLYYPSMNAIYKCETSGATGISEPIIDNVDYVHSMATDSTEIFAVRYTNSPGPNNSIFRAPLAGGSAVVMSQSTSPRHLAVDSQFVYWGDLSSLAVMRISKTGGTATVLSSDNHSRKITVDGSYVYWANGSPPDIGVYRILKTGGTKEKLADATNAWGIAIHGQYVYWSDSMGSTVNRVLKDGGNNEVIAEGNAGNIAADEHAIYWSNKADGRVMKLVK